MKAAKQVVPNYYNFPNQTIGVNIIGHTTEDWKNSLKSKDTAEIMASLMWLGAIHINPQQNYYGNARSESIKEAELVQEIKADSEVKLAVNKLSQSDNKWLRESANLITNGTN